ncbi:MAG: YceD family protein [Lactobacillales bacterium]|jgi:uncharacterized protein|nr:YceD family protein [Lactobacillales bacterium]
MQWSILELQKRKEEAYLFSETFDVKNELIRRYEEIIDASLVSVEGSLSVSSNHKYMLHYALSGTLTLPSTRSLIPTNIPLNFSVDEIFMTKEHFKVLEEDYEEVLIIEEGIIDLRISVEDNILLSIPIQVFSEEEKDAKNYLKGADWEVISEDQYETLKKNKSTDFESVDPRFSKLKDFFKEY